MVQSEMKNEERKRAVLKSTVSADWNFSLRMCIFTEFLLI